MKKNIGRGIFFAVAGAMGWGISGVCSQYLFMNYGTDAGWLTAVRMIFAGILLIILAAGTGGRQVLQVFSRPRDILQLAAFALLGLLLCQFTYMSAIRYSNSATATVLQSLNVVIMALLTSLQQRIRLTLRQIAAVFLAVLGTYFIASGGRSDGLSFTGLGLVMGLLSAVGVVTYTLLARPIIKKYGSICVTGWGMLIGGLVSAFYTRAWNLPGNLDYKAILVIVLIVTLGTAFGFSAFLEGTKYLGPARATLLGCLEPVSAAIFSALFLKSPFGIFDALGFCCILGTVFLSVGRSARESA